MHVALLQLTSDIDAAHNRDLIAGHLADLSYTDGLDLIVLPEASMHDFGPTDSDLAARTTEGLR